MAGHVPPALDVPGERWTQRGLEPALGLGRAVAGQHQRRRLGPPRDERRVGIEQPLHVLSGLERAEEEDIAAPGVAPGLRRVRLPPRPSLRAHAHHRGVQLQQPGRDPPHVGRRNDDQLGRMRGATHEGGVVAADLLPRPLGVQQEIEVVDRDHARGAARGQQQRVRRMDDIVAPPREQLGRRPPQAVPCPVQRSNRHAAIDDPDRSQLGNSGRIWPILPRAGEQLDRQPAFSGPVLRQLDQCPRQLVDVLADPGAFPQGGTIVEQQPHGGNLPWQRWRWQEQESGFRIGKRAGAARSPNPPILISACVSVA